MDQPIPKSPNTLCARAKYDLSSWSSWNRNRRLTPVNAPKFQYDWEFMETKSKSFMCIICMFTSHSWHFSLFFFPFFFFFKYFYAENLTHVDRWNEEKNVMISFDGRSMYNIMFGNRTLHAPIISRSNAECTESMTADSKFRDEIV